MPFSPVTQRTLFTVGLSAMLMLALGTTGAWAQNAPFSIERLVVGTDVAQREPVGVTDFFPARTETVFCFLEARNISRPIEIQLVWYFGDEKVARVPLALDAGPRWRTYARKKIGDRQGNWKVDLQDDADQVLGSVPFVVEQ